MIERRDIHGDHVRHDHIAFAEKIGLARRGAHLRGVRNSLDRAHCFRGCRGVKEAWGRYNAAAKVQHVVLVSTHGSELAHELQRERGFSAGFTGSKGAVFAEQLAKQRRVTDEVMARVIGELRPDAAEDAQAKARAKKLVAALDELKSYRERIDRLELKVPELAKYYTGVIVKLLAASDDHLRLGDGATQASAKAVYHAILFAKEFAGRERAAGANGYGSGQFTTAAITWFLNMQDRQAYQFDRIRSIGSAEDAALLDAALASPEAERVRELRAIAMAAMQTGDLQGVTGPEWFAASSAYLGKLLEVERAMAASIVSMAEAEQASVATMLLILAGATIVLVGVTTLWGLVALRGMINAMRGLKAAIHAIEGEQPNVVVPAQDRKDELGSIARALSRISSQGVTMARIRAAITASNQPILVLDVDGVAIFTNPSAQRLFDNEKQALGAFVSVNEDGAAAYPALIENFNKAVASGARRNFDGSVDAERGDLKLAVNLAEVRSNNEELLGYVVQLNQVTRARRLEADMIEAIENVRLGRFDHKVTSIDDMGFYSIAANGVNRLIDIVRQFTESLHHTVGGMASGDLTRRMPDTFNGGFDEIAQNLNHNLDQLCVTLKEVSSVAIEVKQGAGSIAQGAADLSGRASDQVASLEEASATMEEMSGSIRETAKNASDVSDLTDESRGARRAWPERRQQHGRRHGGYRRQLVKDLQHPLGDRQHRVPDQPVGAERGG